MSCASNYGQFNRSELMSLVKNCYDCDVYEDVIKYMEEIIKLGTLLDF